ncbi:AAA family ATPase [Microbacterium algeriense]
MYLAGATETPASPLRGRASEVGAMLDAMTASMSGRGRPVLLRGRPGMGKTRILAELIAAAESRGWRTFTITPDVDSSAVPLGALLEAGRRSEPALIRDTDLRAALAGSEPQYWVTRLLADGLESAATDGEGVVVVVDDLQWLDASSLTVLVSLVRELGDQPIAWVLASRTGRARAAHSQSLHFLEANGVILDLSPVAATAARAIAADLAGGKPGPKLVDALQRTASVPLLIVEMMRGLREENLLVEEDGVVDAVTDAIPARFGASSRVRIEQLSPEALHFAQVASLFGRTFTLGNVLAATGQTAISSAPAIQQLLAGDFLVEDDDRMSFLHDTIREAAEATIPPALRRAMLREVVRLRIASGEPASAVAAALVETAYPGDRDSFDLIRRAAHQLASSDSAQAADLAEAALQLARHVPQFAEDAAEMLPYLWADGRHVTADAAAHDLTPYLSPQSRARSMLAVARRQTETSFDQAIATCDLALALPDIARQTRAELLAVRALNCANKADFVGLTETLARAREIADPATDHLALATVDATESVYALNSGRFDEAVRLIEAATSRVSEAGLDPARWLPEGLWAAFLHNSLGDPDRALAMVDAGLADSRRAHAVVAEAYWMMIRARVLYELGRLEDARVQAESVLSLSEELNLGDFAHATAGVVLFRIALHTGDVQARAQAGPIMTALAEGPGVTRAGRWMLTLSAIDRGQWAEAVQLADLAVQSLDQPIPAMTTPVDFADDLVLLDLALSTGDSSMAAAVAARAERRHRHNPRNPLAAAIAAAVQSRVSGEFAPASQAVSVLRELSRPLVLARVLEQCDAVDHEADRAVASLSEALAIYESLGAVRDASRVLQALRGRGILRRPRQLQKPQLLSAREQQVLDLVSDGATTQQIADALFMSPHTVISHIRHMYAKTGVNSRAELRGWEAKRRQRRHAG